MAKFEVSDAKTGQNEGGYTSNPNDNGNWTGGKVGQGTLIGTKYGISAPVLCDYLGRTAAAEEMIGLTPATAQKIREKKYWVKIRGNEIKRQDIADSLYDTAINMGCSGAIKLAQKALGILQSGIMDDNTLNALNVKK